MTNSHLLALLNDSACSPEDLGELIGISGMTLRRWLAKPNDEEIPKLYIPAIRDACYQLIALGRLKVDSPSVQLVLAEPESNQYSAALFNLGLSEGFSLEKDSQERILLGLTQIGLQSGKQNVVNESHGKVFSFKKFGKEWSTRITLLWAVIQSRKLGAMDKLVAYGALFYLLTPIDFIPDQIPFIGLLDDFGVLGIAATYYAKKLSKIHE